MKIVDSGDWVMGLSAVGRLIVVYCKVYLIENSEPLAFESEILIPNSELSKKWKVERGKWIVWAVELWVVGCGL